MQDFTVGGGGLKKKKKKKKKKKNGNTANKQESEKKGFEGAGAAVVPKGFFFYPFQIRHSACAKVIQKEGKRQGGGGGKIGKCVHNSIKPTGEYMRDFLLPLTQFIKVIFQR